MVRDEKLRAKIAELRALPDERPLPDYTGEDEDSSARITNPILGSLEVPIPRGSGKFVAWAMALLVVALSVVLVWKVLHW